jgi:hypothetical protein
LNGEEFLVKDTIPGQSNLYFRGYYHHEEYSSGPTIKDSTFYCKIYIGYLTENTRQVFFTDTNGFQRMLFNFNLSVGDSIDLCANDTRCFGPYYVRVDSIDSIFIFDRYRRAFHLNPHAPWSGPGHLLIEGIGMDYGLFGKIDMQTIQCTPDRLFRYYYKDTVAYSLYPGGSRVICPSPPPPDPNPPSVSIYPVPAGDYIDIELKHDPSYAGSRISMYNSIGQRVYDHEMSSNPMRIDMSVFPGSVYILELTDENNRRQYFEVPKAH